nr:Serine/threonine-protein kinase CTR1 [Ipomoea batatas]
MASDQSSRPINLVAADMGKQVQEESHITPVAISGNGNPGFIPTIQYSATPDAEFVGMGFNNGVAMMAGRVPQVMLPTQIGGIGLDHGSSRSQSASGHGADESGEDSVSLGKKVKLLCSFGGKILPRPSDGALRYVGGQTRIISVRRDVSFGEMIGKMMDTYGQDVVIKYQLPDEDLDALVSVSCPDDLENMMDEYEKLVEKSADGSAKLRVFLFSPSEVEAAGALQYGTLQDNGQMYVEAVNGIVEGGGGSGGGGGMRFTSTASASSTQNSEASGADAVEFSGHGQGVISRPPSSETLSTSGISAPVAAQGAAASRVVDSNPAVYVNTNSTAPPLGIHVAVSGPPSNLAAPELEYEKSVPITVQQQQQQQIGFDLQQPGVTFPVHSTYVPDPHREGYAQFPSQIGFPTQLRGNVGPVYAQQPFTAGTTLQQFVPAVHMTMSPSHVSMNPNMLTHLVHPQQVRFEQYPSENTMGQRIVQLPGDQGYGTYQPQLQPKILGGAYGWHQIPHPQQVAFSEGGMAQPPMPSGQEAIPRLDGCYMCQKSLPHAHSDSVAQDQRDSPVSTAPAYKSAYDGPWVDDKGRHMCMGVTTGAMLEGASEHHGAAVGPRIIGHMDHEVGKSQAEGTGVSQNVQNPERPKISLPQGAVGLTSGMQSHYAQFIPTVPQSGQVDSPEQHLIPMQYHVKEDVGVNKAIPHDIPNVGMPFQMPEYLVRESPEGYPGSIPVVLPKEDNKESTTALDHLKQVESIMENLQIHTAETHANGKQIKSGVDNYMDNILENRIQQVGWNQPFTDANHIKLNEMPPSSSTETVYLQTFRAPELCAVSQPSPLEKPDFDVHSRQGIGQFVPDEMSFDNPAFSSAESANPTLNIPVSELQPKLIPTGIDLVSPDGSSTSISPSSMYGAAQETSPSLFSNQDPWNMQRDSHFPPPKPSKVRAKKETMGVKDQSGDHPRNSGELTIGGNEALGTKMRMDEGVIRYSTNSKLDLGSDPALSNKSSAEEVIKQELQAVAEDVAASVLQSSVPSNPEFPVFGGSKYGSISEHNSEVQSSDGETLDRNKFEKAKTKLPERRDFGFPVSDDLGRLQIIRNSDLEEFRELGSGTFGTVYHGKWRGTDVAIKRINERCFAGKPSEEKRMRDDFWNEAIKLADLHHPNVVAFYGVVLDGPNGSVATVTEFMVNGSLRNALQKNERSLDKWKRLLITMDVAFGMEYLHGRNIVHFDLKSDNLLVNLRDPHRPICKVGDLGLSKVKCQTLISGGVRGTLPWMAPELLNGGSNLVSEKVDVFSFGIVMWELLTGEEPYADLHYGAIIGGIVSNTLRPPVPESCDPDWRSLMERCWSAEPSERPNFTEIANELRAIASKLRSRGPSQQPLPTAYSQAKS